MSARRVDSDNEIRRHGQRTFEKTVVRFVADDIELRQRIAKFHGGDGALEQFGMFRENFLIFLNHRG